MVYRVGEQVKYLSAKCDGWLNGVVDAVLEPSETRPRLIADLEVLRHKERPNLPRKHSCGPL